MFLLIKQMIQAVVINSSEYEVSLLDFIGKSLIDSLFNQNYLLAIGVAALGGALLVFPYSSVGRILHPVTVNVVDPTSIPSFVGQSLDQLDVLASLRGQLALLVQQLIDQSGDVVIVHTEATLELVERIRVVEGIISNFLNIVAPLINTQALNVRLLFNQASTLLTQHQDLLDAILSSVV